MNNVDFFLTAHFEPVLFFIAYTLYSPTALILGINEESVSATIAVFAVSAFDIHWNLCMICTMYYYLQSENNKPEIM